MLRRPKGGPNLMLDRLVLNLPLVKFPLVMGALFAFTRWQPFIENVRRPYCEVFATSIAWVFSGLGIAATQEGRDIVAESGRTLTIIPACDGVILLCLFAAGVATISPRLRPRPYGKALAAVLLLIVINWFRLAVLTLAVFYQPQLFEPLHLYFLQGFLILSVVLLFLIWLRSLAAEDFRGGDAPAQA